MTKANLLLCALLATCAQACGDSETLDDGADSRLLADAVWSVARTTSPTEPPFLSAMRACYAEAAATDPELSVHTVGRYLALGDRMMAVRVSIPTAPLLARCIEDTVMDDVPPGSAHAPDALACGSFAIDLGGPPPPLQAGDIERQYQEHEQGMQALMREVVTRGLLPADHPLVREVLRNE